MFISKISIKKADKIIKKRSINRKKAMAVTFIPYKDEPFWRREEWLFMQDNIKFTGKEGFYIKTDLFKVDDVSESTEAEKATKGRVVT